MKPENALEKFIADEFLHEEDSMDELQKAGIISDNCVWASDVADADCQKAIDFLKNYGQ